MENDPLTITEVERVEHALEVMEALAKVNGEEDDEVEWRDLLRKIEQNRIAGRAEGLRKAQLFAAAGQPKDPIAFTMEVAWERKQPSVTEIRGYVDTQCGKDKHGS